MPSSAGKGDGVVAAIRVQCCADPLFVSLGIPCYDTEHEGVHASPGPAQHVAERAHASDAAHTQQALGTPDDRLYVSPGDAPYRHERAHDPIILSKSWGGTYHRARAGHAKRHTTRRVVV